MHVGDHCCSPGLLGFCQKLSLKRGRSDAQGRAAITFLSQITGKIWLVAAMMADGATETLVLIRVLDNEDVDHTSLCGHIQHFLDHVTWMFFEDGVFRIGGHTSYIKQWFENATHHFTVDNVGKSLGGTPYTANVINECLQYMHSWVHLSRRCLDAEFPSFGIIACFSAFQLPRDKPTESVITTVVTKKLRRLQQVFKAPHLIPQFKFHWHHAYLVIKDTHRQKNIKK